MPNHEYYRNYYRDNIERYRESFRVYSKYRATYHRAILRRYKRLKGCKYCDERDTHKLEFHHPEGYVHGKLDDLMTCSLDRIKEEVAACEVVCRTCHRRLHRKGGD